MTPPADPQATRTDAIRRGLLNATFILRALNAHDDLVAALQALVATTSRTVNEIDIGRNVITKGNGIAFSDAIEQAATLLRQLEAPDER